MIPRTLNNLLRIFIYIIWTQLFLTLLISRTYHLCKINTFPILFAPGFKCILQSINLLNSDRCYLYRIAFLVWSSWRSCTKLYKYGIKFVHDEDLCQVIIAGNSCNDEFTQSGASIILQVITTGNCCINSLRNCFKFFLPKIIIAPKATNLAELMLLSILLSSYRPRLPVTRILHNSLLCKNYASQGKYESLKVVIMDLTSVV